MSEVVFCGCGRRKEVCEHEPKLPIPPCKGSKWFRRLTDIELIELDLGRSTPGPKFNFHYNHEVSEGNREFRRRAAKAGMDVYAWMLHVQENRNDYPRSS